MSISLYDERIQNQITSPIQGERYVLLRAREGAADRTFSSAGAQLVTPPPGVALPLASLPGQWNPSGTDGAPSWAIINDGYAVQFTTSGNVLVTVGNEYSAFNVQSPPPAEDAFSVKVLQWDAAWLHTTFVCELSYEGTSDVVFLRARDIATGRILMADIERTDAYTFYCEYDAITGDAIVHITPQPTTAITTRAVVIGDTR